MNIDELEKEAKEYVSNYQGWGWKPKEGSAVFIAMIYSYMDSAEPREKRIAELEAQIEQMKCCSNCDNWNWKHNKCEKKLKGDCFKHSKWVMRNF